MPPYNKPAVGFKQEEPELAGERIEPEVSVPIAPQRRNLPPLLHHFEPNRPCQSFLDRR
jgi:hypothetical protein